VAQKHCFANGDDDMEEEVEEGKVEGKFVNPTARSKSLS
jgi:hypothetical protein